MTHFIMLVILSEAEESTHSGTIRSQTGAQILQNPLLAQDDRSVPFANKKLIDNLFSQHYNQNNKHAQWLPNRTGTVPGRKLKKGTGCKSPR